MGVSREGLGSMRCPFCLHSDSKVLDSRQTEEGASIRRRRECTACSKRFTTYERLDEMPFLVIKKDGGREAFSRTKILNGMMRACENAPFPWRPLKASWTKSKDRSGLDEGSDVGTYRRACHGQAAKLDDVAYVRFASVYRQFKDIDRFIEELQRIRKGK